MFLENPTILVNLNNFPFTKQKWTEFKEQHPGATIIIDECKDLSEFKSKFKQLGDNKNQWNQIDMIAGVKDFYKLDKEVFELLPNLKSVSFSSAGYNQIDFNEATKRNIQISRVFDLDTSTADTNLFLLLGAMRFYKFGIHSLEKRRFEVPPIVGVAPDDKVLGIVGFGAIGKQVAARCKPLGFKKIVYWNRSPLNNSELESQLGVQSVSTLEELFITADVIDLNIALTPETKHLINAEAILKMKDGVIIVNTARGDIIDEAALIEGLKSGKILSAGLDVFCNEPNINYDLANLDNVFALPHLGSFTKVTRVNAQLTVFKNVENFIKTGKLLTYIGEQVGKF